VLDKRRALTTTRSTNVAIDNRACYRSASDEYIQWIEIALADDYSRD